jgi:hypothetical protein
VTLGAHGRRLGEYLVVMEVRARSEIVSDVGRGAHDLALAALIGGNLFGRVAMNPALTDVSDKTERGRVLNRAWRRYGAVNSLGRWWRGGCRGGWTRLARAG